MRVWCVCVCVDVGVSVFTRVYLKEPDTYLHLFLNCVNVQTVMAVYHLNT